MTVGQLDLGIILDLVQKHDAAVGQQPRVHGRNTRLTHDLERAGHFGGGGR